jgi:hypothetical protein
MILGDKDRRQAVLQPYNSKKYIATACLQMKEKRTGFSSTGPA